MSESLNTRLYRWGINHFPCYRRTGARVTYIARDWQRVRIRLPLNLRTRNIVGTIFGGSMYGAVDPIYMTMFLKLLGPGYIVWDKAATIRFRRPGRSTLTAEFVITDQELALVKEELTRTHKLDRTYVVALTDAEGEVCMRAEKMLHFQRRKP